MTEQIPNPTKTISPTKENDVNRVLRLQKKNATKIRILYASVWGVDNEVNIALLNSLVERPEESGTLYVVDSFRMPHSFVIFKINRTPALVTIAPDKVTKEDYLPKIYEELGLVPVMNSV